MAVTPADVIMAYRFIFGREPENQAAVDRLLHMNDLAALRAEFVNSTEFAILSGAKRPADYRLVGRTDIQTRCSEAELAEMTRRIAREWRTFGETEPHWSVLTGQEFLAANIDTTIDMFYASGHDDITVLLKGIERSGIDTDPIGRVLDFGCGVGRLVLALAKLAEHVTGVDISPPHLALAWQRAQASAISNVSFEAITDIDDLDRYRAGFDLVTSYLVIQHNPPPIQAAIVRKLLSALTPGGIAVLQIPTYLEHAMRFSASDYLANRQPSMEMNALPEREIFEIIDESGCITREARTDGVLGDMPGISHTFTIQKKAAS